MLPFVESTSHYDHRGQTAYLCNTPNRAETAHEIAECPRSHFKPQTKPQKSAKSLHSEQQKTRYCAIQQRNSDRLFSDAPPGPALAQTFSVAHQMIAVEWLAETATCKIQRPETGILLQPVGQQVEIFPPRFYDVQTTYLQAWTEGKSWLSFLQPLSTSSCTNLP